MSSIRIRKRGKFYEYCFDVGKINNKRKRITKSGFKTKVEAQEAGTVAYEEYIRTGVIVKECQMSYYDYLDFWYDNYCKVNLKYTTQEAYKNIIEKYLKPTLGLYRLSAITSVTLHNFLTELCSKYTFSRSYFKNILKVMKGTFREATDVYGFIRYNPSLTLKLPRIEDSNNFEKHLYTQDEIDKILIRFKNDDDSLLSLSNKNMKFCLGCDRCKNNLENYCILDDYIVNIVYQEMLNTNKIIIASPMYMSNINGILKNLIDRMNPFYHHPELFEGKKVYLILTGQTSKEENTEEINNIIKYFERLSEWLFDDFEFLDYFEGYNDLNNEINYKEKIEKIKQKTNN